MKLFNCVFDNEQIYVLQIPPVTHFYTASKHVLTNETSYYAVMTNAVRFFFHDLAMLPIASSKSRVAEVFKKIEPLRKRNISRKTLINTIVSSSSKADYAPSNNEIVIHKN